MEAARIQSPIDFIVECGICMDVYQDPRILPCGHTFCLKCLQEIHRRRTDNCKEKNEICALCKQQWEIPHGEMQNIPKNFVVGQIISSLPSIGKCALSEEKNDLQQIEEYCMDEIKKSLNRSRKTYDCFKTKLFENNRMIDKNEKEHYKIRRDVQSFAQKNLKILQDACDKAKQEIANQEAELVKSINNYYTAEKSQLTSSATKLKSICDNQQKIILEHENQMLASDTLKSKFNFVQSMVAATPALDTPSIQSDAVETYSQLSVEEWKSDIDHAVRSIVNVFAIQRLFNAEPVVKIQSGITFAKPLDTFVLFPQRCPQYEITMLAVKNNKILVGEPNCTELFIYDDKGKLLNTIKVGTIVCDAAFAPNGNIICSTPTLGLLVMSEDGKVMQQKFLTSPRDISVSSDGEVFVTDSSEGVFQSSDNGNTWCLIFGVSISSWMSWQTLKLRNDQGEIVYWTLEVLQNENNCRIIERALSGDLIATRLLSMKIANGTDISKSYTRMVYNEDHSVLLIDTKNSSVHSFSVNNYQYEKQLFGKNEINRPTMHAINKKSNLLYIGQEDGTLKIFKLQ